MVKRWVTVFIWPFWVLGLWVAVFGFAFIPLVDGIACPYTGMTRLESARHNFVLWLETFEELAAP